MTYTDWKTRRFEASTAFALIPGGAGGTAMNVVANTPASTRTLTVIDPGGNDSFVFAAASQTLSNKTLGSILNGGGFEAQNFASPTASTSLATKSYVDAAVIGIGTTLQEVILATTAALATNTYSGTPNFTLTATANGALSIDGTTVQVGWRVLVKNESSGSHNGVYTVTQVGDGSHPYILTRATDLDTTAQVDAGAYVFVTQGTTNGGTAWVLNSSQSAVLDTTSLTFNQFTAPGTITAGNAGISVSGSAISAVADGTTISIGGSGIQIATGYVGQTSITTLGPVATGTWNATTIAINKGGTGQTSASAAFNALSPMTTAGDIIYGGSAGAGTRLAANSTATNKYLQSVSSGNPTWAQVAFSDLSGSATSGQLPGQVVYNNQANTYSGGGLQDFSAMTAKLPTTVSFTSAVDNGIGRNAAGIIEHNSGTAGQFATSLQGMTLIKGLSNPTITSVVTGGTTGSAVWGYKIVAKLADGTTTAASPQVTTTSNNGASTLDATHTQTISWSAISGATSYDVYRTQSGGTPSSLGKIGNSTGTNLVDTGLAGDSSTAPSTNNTGAIQLAVSGSAVDTGFFRSALGMFEINSGSIGLYGGINAGFLQMQPLANVSAPTVTPTGGTGAKTYAYTVVALDASQHLVTQAPTATQVTNGATTLNGSTYNAVSWTAVPGAAYYRVYRTSSNGTPSTTGLIATVTAPTTSYNDQGAAGDSSSAPASNNTGSILFATDNVSSIGASGANRPAAIYCAGTVTANAISISTALAISMGGTGQATASAGFNALSPMTTLGDIIYGGSSGTGTRLGGVTAATKNFLTSTGTGAAANAPSWGTLASGDIPAISLSTVGSNGGITGTLGIGNGGTGQTSAAAALSALGGQPAQQSINLQSGNYTITTSDQFVISTATSPNTFTLPTPSSANKGFEWIIGRNSTSSAQLTITPASGTINGQANIPMDIVGDFIRVFNDGTNYYYYG